MVSGSFTYNVQTAETLLHTCKHVLFSKTVDLSCCIVQCFPQEYVHMKQKKFYDCRSQISFFYSFNGYSRSSFRFCSFKTPQQKIKLSITEENYRWCSIALLCQGGLLATNMLIIALCSFLSFHCLLFISSRLRSFLFICWHILATTLLFIFMKIVCDFMLFIC